eukprot:1592607-Pyramimonas_sp.AAC.1
MILRVPNEIVTKTPLCASDISKCARTQYVNAVVGKPKCVYVQMLKPSQSECVWYGVCARVDFAQCFARET